MEELELELEDELEELEELELEDELEELEELELELDELDEEHEEAIDVLNVE